MIRVNMNIDNHTIIIKLKIALFLKRIFTKLP